MKRELVIPADAQARLRMLDANADQKTDESKRAVPPLKFSHGVPVTQPPLPTTPEHRR